MLFPSRPLFCCTRMAPLAPEQRWTRWRNSPKGLSLWWRPPWKHGVICLWRRPRGGRLIITRAFWWRCGVGIMRQQALSLPLFQLNGTEANPIDSYPFIIISSGYSDCVCKREREREAVREKEKGEDVWNQTGRKATWTARQTATQASTPPIFTLTNWLGGRTLVWMTPSALCELMRAVA